MSASPDISHDKFKITVMVILITALLLAVPMMFVHPGITLILVWAGLIVLAGSALIAKLFWA